MTAVARLTPVAAMQHGQAVCVLPPVGGSRISDLGIGAPWIAHTAHAPADRCFTFHTLQACTGALSPRDGNASCCQTVYLGLHPVDGHLSAYVLQSYCTMYLQHTRCWKATPAFWLSLSFYQVQ